MQLTYNKINLKKHELNRIRKSLKGKCAEVARGIEPPVSRNAVSLVLRGKMRSERILRAIIDAHFQLEQQRIELKKKMNKI